MLINKINAQILGVSFEYGENNWDSTYYKNRTIHAVEITTNNFFKTFSDFSDFPILYFDIDGMAHRGMWYYSTDTGGRHLNSDWITESADGNELVFYFMVDDVCTADQLSLAVGFYNPMYPFELEHSITYEEVSYEFTTTVAAFDAPKIEVVFPELKEITLEYRGYVGDPSDPVHPCYLKNRYIPGYITECDYIDLHIFLPEDFRAVVDNYAFSSPEGIITISVTDTNGRTAVLNSNSYPGISVGYFTKYGNEFFFRTGLDVGLLASFSGPLTFSLSLYFDELFYGEMSVDFDLEPLQTIKCNYAGTVRDCIAHTYSNNASGYQVCEIRA